ncbi:hypothetical protein GE09DRAFT_467147 [Coniochaeta sp. 2T2.1]|nr:hypothetical protein GE09DRAFT_467147 [Coniochaeta sp. 2T2.1]
MAPSPTLLATARSYLHALSTISPDGIAAVTTPSFSTTVAPNSTGLTAAPVTRDSLVQRYRGLKAVLSSMNVQVEREWPLDEGNNQVIVWTTARAEFRPEIVGKDKEEDWTFNPETLFVFTMDETGEKVESLFEFQDSVALRGMDAVFGRAMERLGGRGGSGEPGKLD